MGRRKRRSVEDCNNRMDRVDEITIHAEKVVIKADRVIVEEQDRRGRQHSDVAGEMDQKKDYDQVAGDFDDDNHHGFGDVEDSRHKQSDRRGRRDPWSKMF